MKRNLFFGLMLLCFGLVAGLSSCTEDNTEKKPLHIVLYNTSLEAVNDGEQLMLNYSINNPIEGEELQVSCEAEWVTDIITTASFISFTVECNDSGERRTAELKLTYGPDRVAVAINQEPYHEPLTLHIEEVGATSVTISVEALDPETTWIGQIVGREWFEAYSEDEIFDEDRSYYNTMAEENGMSLEEYLGSILSRGSHDNIRMGGLDIETEYVVYIYGLTPQGIKTTKIYSDTFTTTEPYQGNDVTFDIDIEVNRALASISITPSHEGVAYFNNLITREDFELYGSDVNAAADGVIAKIIEDYSAWDYTLAETFDYNTDYVATSYEFEAMANTDYLVFAFKWNEECQRLSEVSYEWFTVGDIPPSENQITLNISDITQSTFFVEALTTTPDPYIIFAEPVQELAKMRSDDDIYEHLVEKYGHWNLSSYICQDNTEGTFSGLEAGTDYAVLAFGYEAGVRTTSIVRKNITTLKAGDIDACQYDIVISNIGDREASVTITPSDYSIWYYWNVFEADATEQEIKAYIEQQYNSTYYGDYWEFSYYEMAQGAVDSYLAQLKPSTDYKIVIIPMNPNRFEYTGSMRTGGEFRTDDAVIADITITAGFDAYYDGDEAYAISPQYMSSWQGWVIIPMNVTIEGNYSHFLYTIFNYTEGLEDPEVFSDDTLIDNLYNVGAYWAPAYFRGVWDVPMMIAAVAFDGEGNPSPVYRECFTCTKENAGDTEAFVNEYLDNLGVTRSVVYNDRAMSTNEPAMPAPVTRTTTRSRWSL